MNITYLQPLSRAWGRMKKALFQPFDLGKWLTLGFTAFLAGLADWDDGGGGGGSSKGHGKAHVDWQDVLDFPHVAWDWLLDHPGWFTLIIFGLLVLLIVVILLTWLSSRGKFMFLDNVVHDRSNVTKPWHDFRELGNSLFFWRLCFGFICFSLCILFLIFCYTTLYGLYESYSPRYTMIFAVVGMVFAFLIMMVIVGYITLFLNDFVVPIMYRSDIKTLEAWGRFLSLFSRYVLYFLFYGILVFFLHVLVVIGVLIVGLLTCCVGFIFLIIPYISSVITLPFSYTFRAFSLEFLEQFGPEYSVFPQSDDASATGGT